jgi:hypothetical protein
LKLFVQVAQATNLANCLELDHLNVNKASEKPSSTTCLFFIFSGPQFINLHVQLEVQPKKNKQIPK